MDNKINQQALPMTTQNGQTNFSVQNRQQAVDLINKVFKSLKAIFPAWAVAIKDQEIESQARQEWLKGLIENKVTNDYQIEAGLSKCRAINSPFLPSIGQFVSWCLSAGKAVHPPFESCYAELTAFIRAGRRDWNSLSDILHHTVRRNLDLYTYLKLEKEYERIKSFEIAYNATLFQLECGEQLYTAPPPETLIEEKTPEVQSYTPKAKTEAENTLSGLLAMLDDKPEQKQLTAAEIADLERLERLK